MRKHGVGDLTSNRKRVINLCEENNLIIGGTLFTHKNIHKLTWTSLDGRTQSQIDHIIINGKWRGSLLDVRVMRNAVVGCDHNLLVARITLKLRNSKNGMARNQRPDISRLKDTLIKEKFRITPRSRICILQDNVDLTIDDLNIAMMESVLGTIGYTKTCKSDWISPDTWRSVKEIRQFKKKASDSKSPCLKQSLNIEKKTNEQRHQREATKDSMWRDTLWKQRQPLSERM